MLKPETLRQIDDALIEILQAGDFRDGELVCSGDLGMEEFGGFPVRIDWMSMPKGELHVVYTNKAGRRHVVKVLNVANELEAVEIAKKMVRVGPATAAEMLADYARLKEIDDAEIEESRRQFEAGEIAEEDVYQGDFLLQGGGYPLRYEARLRDQKVGAFMPITVRMLEDFKGGDLVKFTDERAQELIEKEAVRYLDSLAAV